MNLSQIKSDALAGTPADPPTTIALVEEVERLREIEALLRIACEGHERDKKCILDLLRQSNSALRQIASCNIEYSDGFPVGYGEPIHSSVECAEIARQALGEDNES